MGIDIPISRIKVPLPRRRSDLLSRPRLNTLVDELLENKLVLVSAQAGYGKTSLLIESAYRYEIPFCWFNLDALDQDILQFVAHFAASIDKRFPGFEKSCAHSLQAAFQNHRSPDEIARLLADEVFHYVREHLVLVLDNYHLVDQSSAVNAFVNRFIQD